MKLNGTILIYHLSRYFNVDYSLCSHNIWAKTPVFYNIFFNMNEHIVLLSSKDLKDCVQQVHRCILICLDKPSTFYDPLDNDLIVLDDSLASRMILNILIDIFDSFNEWISQLNEALYKTMSFQDMTEIISEMVQMPTALLNQDFRYIAYSKNSGTYAELVDSQNYLPLEAATTLLDRSDFKQLETIKEAFTYVASEEVVYKNIYYEGNYVGRLSVLLDKNSDIEYIKTIFDYTAFYIETLYAQSQSFDIMPLKLSKLHEYLKRIFNQDTVNKDHFLKAITRSSTKPTDTYYVICFISNEIARTAYSLTYLCSQIEQMWPGAYCIPYEEHIVLLLNESLFQRKSSLDFHHELMYFIRDGLLLVGISRPFSNIAQVENIYAGYLQAQYALEQGRILNPTNWCHSFEHYALHYLVKNGSEPFHPEQICHPAILKLIKHDEQHETSFTRTILAYIKCRYNAVAAAKSLYIHRSSFINRMERIKELIFIDWDDTDERLYLFLSFKILEMF